MRDLSSQKDGPSKTVDYQPLENLSAAVSARFSAADIWSLNNPDQSFLAPPKPERIPLTPNPTPELSTCGSPIFERSPNRFKPNNLDDIFVALESVRPCKI